MSSSDWEATNLLPDIVTDLLARKDFGVGEYVGIDMIDLVSMRTAGNFCHANDFTWDGVISDRSNIRDFIFENAGFALLDFTIIGGKFGLIPSVPYYTDSNAGSGDETQAGHINHAAKPGDPTFEIRALFTDGNMRNFKVSFLPPEEREMFTAEVLYRKETENGFPESEAVTVRLTTEQGGFFRDPVESFDCTQFMTSQAHAIRFAKYALLTRKYVDHSVSFETTPDGAANLYPGAYIRVASEVTHYEPDGSNDWGKRFSVGCITPNGKVITGQEDIDGKNVYYWNSSMSEVRTATINVTNDYTVSDTALHGTLFSVIPDVQEPRVYRVEALTINEDSMVEIAATVVPLTADGRMKVTQWSGQNFIIQGPDK
jgi:predicted phage tail protein